MKRGLQRLDLTTSANGVFLATLTTLVTSKYHVAYGDGTGAVQSSATVTKTYPDATSKRLSVSLNQIRKVTNVSAASMSITKADMRGLIAATSIILNGNSLGSTANLRLPRATKSNLTVLNLSSCGLTGALDLSALTKLGGTVSLQSNAGLTSVAFPPALDGGVGAVTLNVSSCGLVGALDVSPLTRMTSLSAGSNAGLTSISMPAVTGDNVTLLSAPSCNITGVLDLSAVTRIGGQVLFQLNPLLTGVTFPSAVHASANTITSLNLGSCGLTGTLDLSKLTKLGGALQAGSNAGLTSVTFPPAMDASSPVFTVLTLSTCGLTGTLDLSKLTKLGGSLNLNGNAGLTSVTFPPVMDASSLPITTLNLASTNMTGTLDLSALTKLGGTVQVGSSGAGLTSVVFPAASHASSTAITILTLSGVGLTGTLDLSGMTKLGGALNLNNNAGLTSVTFPAAIDPSAANVTALNLTQCSLAGTLDLSGMTKLGGTVQMQNNAALTSITFPASATTFNIFNASGCSLNQTFPFGTVVVNGANTLALSVTNNGMSAANVNATIDNMFSGRLSFNNSFAKSLNIDGTNAAATGTYAMPASGYVGSIHDQNEVTLTTASAGWTQKEKAWVLANLQVSSGDPTLRYQWTLTLS